MSTLGVTPRLLSYRPNVGPAPTAGAASTSTVVAPVSSSTPVVNASASFGSSWLNSLEQIRQDALHMISNWVSPVNPNPASPAFALPELDKLLQTLKPKPSAPAPSKPQPAPQPTKPQPAPAKNATVTVQKGDSLSLIAKRVLGDGNRWREIFELNRDQLKDPNKIFPGMVLKVPGGQPAANPAKPKPSQAPSTPVVNRPVSSNFYARRDEWFISQFKAASNPNEDTPNNGNCGPTSVTMIAKAFGKINPSAAQADAAIEETRRRIGESRNENEGTSVEGLGRAARSYGLDADVNWNASIQNLQSELAKGRLVIVHGVYIRANGTLSGGGHYMVVTKIENGQVYLNDSAYSAGPRVVSADTFMASIRKRGTYGYVSIGN